MAATAHGRVCDEVAAEVGLAELRDGADASGENTASPTVWPQRWQNRAPDDNCAPQAAQKADDMDGSAGDGATGKSRCISPAI